MPAYLDRARKVEIAIEAQDHYSKGVEVLEKAFRKMGISSREFAESWLGWKCSYCGTSSRGERCTNCGGPREEN
jgi:rubrerythrin